MKTKDLNTTTLGSAAMLILCGLASTSLAGDEAVETKSSGILPLPDYSGDFLERSYLLGDFGGLRTEWAEKGFTFDIDYNQYFQSVVDGGLDTGSGYGATIDYDINVDFDRMGLIPGGLLSMRSVSRYGNSVNGKSGTLVPVNTYATYPTTANPDDSVGLWLPVINYTQFLSEKFAVGFGKYDTLDSPNEFSGGRGQSQVLEPEPDHASITPADRPQRYNGGHGRVDAEPKPPGHWHGGYHHGYLQHLRVR